ncbi:hypothetical protein [Devriesea agamarum]|nr:hypothetical protein [Devriesea agamarum]
MGSTRSELKKATAQLAEDETFDFDFFLEETDQTESERAAHSSVTKA